MLTYFHKIAIECLTGKYIHRFILMFKNKNCLSNIIESQACVNIAMAVSFKYEFSVTTRV